MSLSPDELTRYSRHLFLREVGRGGQLRLKEANVLVVGAGGLGSPVLLYLAAAGVGHLSVVDHDLLELSNLQRQILYSTDDLGRPKAESAARRLSQLNPEIEIQPLPLRLEPANALGLFRGYDLVIEGSDNFPTKFLTNDVCVLEGIPLLIGGILRFEGQAQWVLPEPKTPCYRCIFERLPPEDAVPSCSEAGVLGAVAGFVGSWMASEALKFLLGLYGADGPKPCFVRFDLLNPSAPFRNLSLSHNPDCPVCGTKPEITGVTKENYFYS